MPRQFTTYAVTIPPTTPESAPHTERLVMNPRVVRSIRWRVPPGPRGEMGFAVGNAAQRVVPSTTSGWIITDNDADQWTLTTATTSGTWWLLGYNTGTYPHTVYLTFGLTLPSGPAARTLPVPGTTLSTTLPSTTTGAPPTLTLPPGTPTPPTLPPTTPAPTSPPVAPTPTTPVTAPPSTTAGTVPTPTLPPPPTF